jgi:hypothetical protein
MSYWAEMMLLWSGQTLILIGALWIAAAALRDSFCRRAASLVAGRPAGHRGAAGGKRFRQEFLHYASSCGTCAACHTTSRGCRRAIAGAISLNSDQRHHLEC